MSVNAARRSRRATPAAESDPSAAAAATAATGDDPAERSARRRPSSSRVVSFPEPTIQTTTYAPTPFTPAPLSSVPSAPPPPAEEPATLHPSDRRSYGHGASPAPVSSRYASVDQLAIGEIDQTLFDCPACRRPLALGARRCPGCGSLLVRSVLLRKAALFVATGALVGGLLGLGGGLVVGGALAGSGAVAVAVGGSATPSTAPSGSAAGSAAPTAPPSTVSTAPPTAPPSTPPATSLPFAVRSAFVQLLGANAKLGDAEADLRAALAVPVFDPSAVATTLRSVSAQTLFASQLAAAVAAWPGSGDLGPAVVDYYTTLHQAAATALDNSVRNAKAYQTAARSVAGLLRDRAAIDASIRAAATAAGDPLSATP
jgi:hypothetical protein